MLHRIGTALVVLLALACGGPAAWAGKVGPEFPVNTHTESIQRSSSVARLSRGGFVVTWESARQDDSSGFAGIYGQRYSAAGIRVGGEFQVNSHTPQNQVHASVSGLGDGGFVVTWTSGNLSGSGQDGSQQGVYGQRYHARGGRDGVEFQINSHTTDNQSFPSVAGLGNGGFVVTWTSKKQDGSLTGVYGQRYSAEGTSVDSEFRVNTHTLNDQLDSSVAALSDGGFVVVWMSYEQENDPGSGFGIYGQRYGVTGEPVGGEFQVNTRVQNQQMHPSVAGFGGGGFVVTWTSAAQDGPGTGIYGQRYSSAGARVGGEFRVNTTAGYQKFSSVAALTGGRFVVTWQSDSQDGSGTGIYSQRYNSTGRVGSEFQVNTHTANDQSSPSVAGLNNDSFVVTWHSLEQDGSLDGIYGQRFVPDAAPKITLDPVSQTVLKGQSVTFTADASGSPTPAVQWQSRGRRQINFVNITDATAKVLTFSTTLAQNGNQYRAVFSNALGTATTNAAILTVTSIRSLNVSGAIAESW